MMNEFATTGKRLVRQMPDGRGFIWWFRTRCISAELTPFVGEYVHVHDGYVETLQISEWLDEPRFFDDGVCHWWSRAGTTLISALPCEDGDA